MLSKSEYTARQVFGLCWWEDASIQDKSFVNSTLCNKTFSENIDKQLHAKKQEDRHGLCPKSYKLLSNLIWFVYSLGQELSWKT